MGIVFGITGTKGPEYNILYKAASGYEIRSYPGFVTAEVVMNDANGNNGFGILAKYIGVFGNPENIASQSMDMTHPVIMDSSNKKGKSMAMTHPVIMESSAIQAGETISMTSPVINNKNVMKFVLPSNYKKVSQVPVPTDKRVVIKETPEHFVAVLGFSGWYTPDKGIQQFRNLVKLLKQDNYLVSKLLKTSSTSTSDKELSDDDLNIDYQVAQYHPPFTLPFCRLNEIWIKLNPKSSPALEKLLKDMTSSKNTAGILANANNDNVDITACATDLSEGIVLQEKVTNSHEQK